MRKRLCCKLTVWLICTVSVMLLFQGSQNRIDCPRNGHRRTLQDQWRGLHPPARRRGLLHNKDVLSEGYWPFPHLLSYKSWRQKGNRKFISQNSNSLSLFQVIQVSNFNVDFGIGHVFIQLNNLFNGENKLLADTVNKFLNDHSQEVIKEVRGGGFQ